MSIIILNSLNLTELTESDLILFCQLNQIKVNKLEELYLSDNSLIDIDFITENTPFINLKILDLKYNKIMNIKNIKYLNNLEKLDISLNKNLKEINEIQYLTELNYLNISNTDITDIKSVESLKKIKELSFNYLFLDNEKETVKIIKTMKSIETLYSWKTFKTYTRQQLEEEFSNIKHKMCS